MLVCQINDGENRYVKIKVHHINICNKFLILTLKVRAAVKSRMRDKLSAFDDECLLKCYPVLNIIIRNTLLRAGKTGNDSIPFAGATKQFSTYHINFDLFIN